MTLGQRKMLAEAASARGGKLYVTGSGRVQMAKRLQGLGMGTLRMPREYQVGAVFTINENGRANVANVAPSTTAAPQSTQIATSPRK